MSMQSEDWSERIQKFLDGELSAGDTRALLEAAERDAGLRTQLAAMKLLHMHLNGNVLEAPPAGFTQRVMAGLEHLPRSVRHSPRNGLLLLMGVLVACTVLMLLFGSDLLPGGAIQLDTSQLPLASLRAPFVVNLKWVINGLILVNLALGLILLDRTVLKPFFGQGRG